MEVDLSEFFVGKCTLSRMGACRVPPGSVPVLSPRVPSQMSVWNNSPDSPHISGTKQDSPPPLLKCV